MFAEFPMAMFEATFVQSCNFLAIALSGEALEWLTVFGYVALAAIACWGAMFSPIKRK
ncbi:MAG: hypothetical protein AAGA67_12315 [Cyanobacteria bacterium P01_F01_bin.153]